MQLSIKTILAATIFVSSSYACFHGDTWNDKDAALGHAEAACTELCKDDFTLDNEERKYHRSLNMNTSGLTFPPRVLLLPT